MRLEKCVLELLYHHDCVVIPQWGGLIANYRAARLNSVSHVISPPSKHIGFNGNLIADDGLLAHHLGLVLGISHQEASRLVQQEVAQIQTDLRANGRVVWDKIGIFYRDSAGALQFIPQDQENFLMSSFGLHPIQLKVVRKPETPDLELQPEVSSNQWHWKYAAAAVLPLALVGGLWWATQQSPSQGMNWANLNPWANRNVISAYQPTPQYAPWPEANTFDETERFEFGTVPPVPATQPTEEQKNASEKKQNVRSGKYAVVGGAFKVKENADKFLTALHAAGFDAQMISSSTDLYMVAYGIYSSRQEAQNAAGNIRTAEGKSAWIKTLAHGK